MRKRFFQWLLATVVLGLPAAAHAQEVIPRPFVGPLSHPRYETGGFFAVLEGLYWRTNRTLGDQTVAIRGFVDVRRVELEFEAGVPIRTNGVDIARAPSEALADFVGGHSRARWAPNSPSAMVAPVQASGR